jgi:hypothetical protein
MVVKLICVYLTLLALILSACQARVNGNNTVTQLPSQTPAHIFTHIPEGLDTPYIPARTSTTTPTPPTPSPTLSPQDNAETILKELYIEKEWTASPNGMCVWENLLGYTNTEAASLKYNNQIFEYATVTCGGDSKKWVLVDKWAEGGLGYSIPALLGWSVDGNYLYFYDKVIPDGCQPLGGFQQDLRRANLSNGNINSIPIPFTGGLVLSPNTTKLVYYDPQTIEVATFDLETGQEKRIHFELPLTNDTWSAGNFTWSPDENNVVFIIQWGPCSPVGISLRRINFLTNAITTLYESENPNISILKWQDSNHILISIDKKECWLDPNTGNIVLAPVCPSDCVITQTK